MDSDSNLYGSGSGSGSGLVNSPYGRLIGYQVQDGADNNVGHVASVWAEEDGQPLFISVKTGWIFGKHHVVPVSTAEVNDGRELVRLPFTEDQIKNAPSFDEDADLLEDDQAKIFSYYGLGAYSGAKTPSRTASSAVQEEQMLTPPVAAETREISPASASEATVDQTIKLKEEELRVGKRQVEAGGVRLRKIVRTETVNQPVELKREEIVIERVTPTDVTAATDADADFKEEDIYVPLRREEAVVEKRSHVREEVRVGKKTEIERQQVSGEVRREDIQVDQSANTKPTTPRTT